jgi:hypothetical protein
LDAINNQVKTITEIEEFKDIINQLNRVVFFVHSTWSGTSLMGLNKIEKLIDSSNTSNLIVIDNTSAESFIYAWLKDQETINDKSRVGSWIHGNGELIGVNNGKIEWFEKSTLELNENQLIEKIK